MEMGSKNTIIFDCIIYRLYEKRRSMQHPKQYTVFCLVYEAIQAVPFTRKC